MKVVFESDEIVLADFCIGGIGVFNIDRAGAERFITETVIDSLHVSGWQAVTPNECWPAIAPIEKFVRQAVFQFRMSAQIADGANGQPLRRLASHGECPSVIEAKLRRHADAIFGQFRLHHFRRDVGILQNLFRKRAGIFWVDVDLPAAQSFPDNDRSTHARAKFDGDSGLA